MEAPPCPVEGPVRREGASITPIEARPGLSALAALAEASGIRHVHLLAWRDLAHPEAGGSEVHMARIASLWARAGLEVTVRTSQAAGLPAHEEVDGYRVVRHAGRYGVFPDTAVREALRRHGPIDAVVEAWNGVPFLTPLWFRGPRVAMVHHVHQEMWDLVLPPRLAAAGRFVEARLAPPLYRGTTVLTLSSSSRSEIVRRLGLPAERIGVVPPGIDERFGPDPAEPRADHPLVLAVGRLMPTKRFDALVRLCAPLRDRHPGLELVIAGEGYERPALEAVVRELDAGSWVRLAGRVDDDELLALYRRAWVVAATSMAEGWGMTLTEAAACGTPAVATDIAGHRDSVEPGVSGLLGADDDAVADHLDAVIGDQALRRRLSEGALDHASSFTWEATAAGVLSALAEQAQGERRRTR